MPMAFVSFLAFAGAGLTLLALLHVTLVHAPARERRAAAGGEASRSWEARKGEAANRRVLVVGQSAEERRTSEVRLGAAGYDVRSCAGPDGPLEDFPYGGCLLLDQAQCPLASGADAIVFGLPLDSWSARRVLRGYRKTRPDTPLCVQTSERDSEWYSSLLRDCQVTPEADGAIVGVVERALDAV